RHPRIGGQARRRLVAAYMAVAVVGWPLAVTLEGRGSLELLVIDVGQGDALAVRTPGGRWLLVDAGPPADGPAPAHPVVATLRARGVRRLEALVLTHPDADHFGGAGAVLTSFGVGRVLDPLLPAPKPAYADVLEIAQVQGVPWSAARAGMKWTVDDVEFEVLHPGEILPEEANEASVVILLRWREFEALLTGDAGVDVERDISSSAGDIEVLKVGHHGSRTSTGSDLLGVTRPELAVISAGRRNRYGHPHGEVVERLDEAGVRIVRTDVHGDIRLLVRRSGRMDVRLQRAHVGG
ncbi:MAG: MBL fold metallo-hydrolase, partial [Gemmatimonadetes bacterium]|nr:MBL fold metallo-hydrolase [Gemmatimonadota bacterium]